MACGGGSDGGGGDGDGAGGTGDGDGAGGSGDGDGDGAGGLSPVGDGGMGGGDGIPPGDTKIFELDADIDAYPCGGADVWLDHVGGLSGLLLGGFASVDCDQSNGWVGNPEAYALDFGGHADALKVDFPYNAALNPDVFTAEVWAKVEGGSGVRSPLTSRSGTASPDLRGYLFYATNLNNWEAWLGVGTSWSTLGGAPVIDGKWTHLVLSYDGATMKFYVDGQLVSEKAEEGFLPNMSQPLRVGAGGTEGEGSFFFSGQVAKVAVHNVPLNDSQISASYLEDFDRFHRVNCAEVLIENPSAPSGPYSLGADGDSIGAYCDMDSDGGGWTLIGKVDQNNYTELSDGEYLALVANPVDDVNPKLLTSGAEPLDGQIAFFNRAHTNALWAASSQVVRVTMTNNTNNEDANGTYFQKKITGATTFDLWAGLRNAVLWGSSVAGERVLAFDTDYQLAEGSANFDPLTNEVTNTGTASLGWFSLYPHDIKGGEQLIVSRHGGLVCDGHGETQAWMLTLDPIDARWKNDDNETRSVLYVR